MSWLTDIFIGTAVEVGSEVATDVIEGAVSGVTDFVGDIFSSDDDWDTGLDFSAEESGVYDSFWSQAGSAISQGLGEVAKKGLSGAARSQSPSQIATSIARGQSAVLRQVGQTAPQFTSGNAAQLQQNLAVVGQSNLFSNMNYVDGNYVKRLRDALIAEKELTPRKGITKELASAASVSPKIAQRLKSV
jgi:hypothetical protein